MKDRHNERTRFSSTSREHQQQSGTHSYSKAALSRPQTEAKFLSTDLTETPRGRTVARETERPAAAFSPRHSKSRVSSENGALSAGRNVRGRCCNDLWIRRECPSIECKICARERGEKTAKTPDLRR